LSGEDFFFFYKAKREVGHLGESEASQLARLAPNISPHPLPPFPYVILFKKWKNIYIKGD